MDRTSNLEPARPRTARVESLPYAGFAQVYDALLGDRFFARARRNFEHLRGCYALDPHSAADVACGTGTFVRHLASLGLRRLYGVDRSADMLALAIEKNRDNPARFFCQDLKDLTLPGPVDLITCNFDSLNYLLTADDLLRALRSFHAALNPEAWLIFDMITPYQPWRGATPWVEQTCWNGVLFQRRMEISPRTGMQKSVVRITRNGRTSREVHRQRVYSIQTVLALLRRANLLPLGVHDFYSLLPPSGSPRRVVYVAKESGGM